MKVNRLFAFLIILSFSSFAQIQITFNAPEWNRAMFSGNMSIGDIGDFRPSFIPTGTTAFRIQFQFIRPISGSDYAFYVKPLSEYAWCPFTYAEMSKITDVNQQKEMFVSWANTYLSSLSIPIQYGPAPAPFKGTSTIFSTDPASIAPERIEILAISNVPMGLICKYRDNSMWAWAVLRNTTFEEIIPPSVNVSMCSLNSQNLNLNYSSTSLNVNGLTESTSLFISCTTGTAKNYQLRLTGANVINGRLNFGNGVSAQVSLNGTEVSANGSGISLNGLTSGAIIPVRASLVGVANTSGITTANGVLILEAL